MDLAELKAWEAKELEKAAAAAAEARARQAGRNRSLAAWQALFRLCDWASNPNGVFDPTPLRTIREVLTEKGQWENLVAVHKRTEHYESYDSKSAHCVTSAILSPEKGEALLLQGVKFADWHTKKGLGSVLDALKTDIEHWNSIVSQEREALELQERKAADEKMQSQAAQEAAAIEINAIPPAAARVLVRPTVDERMETTLATVQESRGWTARQWATHLDCSVGSIGESKIWAGLQTLKLAEKIRAGGKPKDRRRKPKASELNRQPND